MRCNAPPILKTAEGALNEIALLIGVPIEGVSSFPRRIIRDDGQRATAAEKLAQTVTIVGRIGGTHPAGREWTDKAERGADIAKLTGRYVERDEPPEGVADGVDFGRAPAA